MQYKKGFSEDLKNIFGDVKDKNFLKFLIIFLAYIIEKEFLIFYIKMILKTNPKNIKE